MSAACVAGPEPVVKGGVRRFVERDEPVGPHDQAVRVCPLCHGPLRWRYREAVTWDRGLPVCAVHGLLRGWHVVSRDGRRLLALARVDNKGRVLQRPVRIPRPALGPGRVAGRWGWLAALGECRPVEDEG